MKNVLNIIGVVLGDPVEGFPQIEGIVSPRFEYKFTNDFMD